MRSHNTNKNIMLQTANHPHHQRDIDMLDQIIIMKRSDPNLSESQKRCFLNLLCLALLRVLRSLAVSSFWSPSLARPLGNQSGELAWGDAGAVAPGGAEDLGAAAPVVLAGLG